MRRALSCLLLASALGQAYQLRALVVDGAGRRLAGPGYRCGFSVGQTAASGPLAGTGYRAVLGFWNRPFQLVGISEEAELEPVPPGFGFHGVAPNPFAAGTTVRYSLAVETDVNLRVLDRSGREVGVLVRGSQPAGEYRVTWDARTASRRELPGGVYFVEFSAGRRRELVKAVVAR
ncbi:MAG: FlgD immunoglobulin-like domain containing protein [bacterium]